MKRTLTGLGLLAVLLGFIFLTGWQGVGQYFFDVLVLAVAAFCTYEMVKVFKEREYRVILIPIIVLVVITYPLIVGFSFYDGGHAWWGYLISAAIFLVLSFGFFIFDTRVTLKDFLATLFVGVYPFLLISLAFLLMTNYGMLPVLVALGGALCSDAVAYYMGSFLKGPKIFPKISPKKTYSGSLMGILGGAIGTMIVYLLFELAPLPVNAAYRFTETLRYPILFYVLIGIGLAVVSELGDLAASRIKRELGVKDYSHALGSHGGVMDRLDSIMFAVLLMSVVMPFLPGAVG